MSLSLLVILILQTHIPIGLFVFSIVESLDGPLDLVFLFLDVFYDFDFRGSCFLLFFDLVRKGHEFDAFEIGSGGETEQTHLSHRETIITNIFIEQRIQSVPFFGYLEPEVIFGRE